MTHRPDSRDPTREQTTISYSGGLRRAFNVAAVLMALLPIPVALLQVLPAYRIQARFLAYFTPLVCLLALAYLFYVRDSLARVMFAHLLDPLPDKPYYRERSEMRMRRVRRKARRVFLALIPPLLLLVSFSSMTRYVMRMEQSLAKATALGLHDRAMSEDVGFAPSDRTLGRAARTDSATRDQQADRTTGQAEADESPAVPGGLPWRIDGHRHQEVLQAAGLDDIPYFAELTAWYVGSFLAAVVALAIMGFREYAKDALGLSERDIVLGRILGDPE